MTLVLAFLRKYWLTIAAAIACLVVVAVVWGGVARWKADSAAREAAQARAGVILAEGGEAASSAATEAVAGLGERDVTRTEQAKENRDAILAAPNARDDAGATGAAGRSGLCKRASYRDHPDCAGLRGSHPASTPR
ncbi:MAG: hypothetical protein Q7T61_00840 [Caulobacter sp.]|nr:hypothetical protein [Caulobacter sp.]